MFFNILKGLHAHRPWEIVSEKINPGSEITLAIFIWLYH